jgi:hypothetical protein
MASPSLDIFKENMRGNPVWREVVPDLQIVRQHLRQFGAGPSWRILCHRSTNLSDRCQSSSICFGHDY